MGDSNDDIDIEEEEEEEDEEECKRAKERAAAEVQKKQDRKRKRKEERRRLSLCDPVVSKARIEEGKITHSVDPIERDIKQQKSIIKPAIEKKKKGGNGMPPLVQRPYKKWADQKLDTIISQVESKISIVQDKLQMYHIRLRRYAAERTYRDNNDDA